MHPLLLVLAVLASPVRAQEWEPVRQVEADLDADGVTETYALREDATGDVELVVTEGEWERVVPDAASTGTMAGERPALGLSEGGLVLLTSMHEGMGWDRWRMRLTIAHRDDDWRIAGYTYRFYDTLDLTNWGTCDLNLLSGRGIAETPNGKREVEAPPAPLLWDWSASELPLPLGRICFG